MLSHAKKRGIRLSLIAWIPLLALVLAWAATNKNVTVKVCGQPTAYLNPIAGTIYNGESVTLTWSSTNGDTLGSSGPNFSVSSLSGSQSSGPLGNGTYTFTVTPACGSLTASASRSVTVTNPPPPPPPPDPQGGVTCFVAGTKINMADGTYKNVEDLKLGDIVRSFDVATGKFVTAKVTVATTKKAGDFYQVNDNEGVTPLHEFFANGKWTTAENLKVGDTLMNEKGEPITITSIVKRPGPVDVFPIRVEDPPATYFAGAPAVLVHNRDRQTDKGEGLVAGTLVRTARGKFKPVENVREGDWVLTYIPSKGGFDHARVLSASKETVAEYLVINGKLQIGSKHRMFIGGRSKTKNLKGMWAPKRK